MFGPIEECIGCNLYDLCDGLKKEIEIPESSLTENAVSYFTAGGVVVDTYFLQNDKETTSPVTILWPNILRVNVQKSRVVPRGCGTCALNPFTDNAGISYYNYVKMGLLTPCCFMMCSEQVVPNYSEVTFFSSPKGYAGMQTLINADPRLQSRCSELAKEDKALLVGTDISKITIKGLKNVDQYTSDLQRVSAQFRDGQPLAINLNKKTIVFNPDAHRGGGGGDGGGKQNPIMFIF